MLGKYLDQNADVEVKGRQIQLVSSILADVSKPTKMLVAKLNCETKCEICEGVRVGVWECGGYCDGCVLLSAVSAEEVYGLAVGVFQAKDSGTIPLPPLMMECLYISCTFSW